jgi:uncharacterized protein (DUF2062 family)
LVGTALVFGAVVAALILIVLSDRIAQQCRRWSRRRTRRARSTGGRR